MGTLTLDLLGGFELRTDDGIRLSLPSQKYRALLAFLAVSAGRAHGRDGLVALLWDELPREQARAALRQAIWALRRALNRAGAAALVLDGDQVALDARALRVDVTEFVQAALEADAAALARAAALYRGPLLAGMSGREAPFEEWLTTERERLADLAVTALGRLLAVQRAGGDLDEAVQTALRLLAVDPCQEAVHRILMQTYMQLGRRSAALRQYQSCVTVLQRELGVEPEAETRALHQEIVSRRPVLPTRGPAQLASPGRTETPLIGRDRELTRLRGALGDAVAGCGRVVALVGEAGIGKTRLVTELLRDAAGRGARAMVGRAHESDQMLPLAPWSDALRRARLADDPALLAALQPAWRAEIARFVPEVGGATPIATHGGYDYVQLFEGVGGLVSALGARSPLVIVLEDLHWADEVSLRLVSSVAHRIDGMPILLVVTSREEEGAVLTFDRMFADLPADLFAGQLSLGPLGRDHTLHLVRVLEPGRDAGILASMGQRIWTASEGHPFMVVEMVRALGESADTEAPTLPLPQRVRRLIEDRFERLTPTAGQLLAAAAVIGRDFGYPLLQRASGAEEDEALAALEELVRRRVVQASGERFEFTHDRFREVAYALLLPPRRQLLHRRVAEALESLDRCDDVEHRAAVGAHYAQAADWPRAAQSLYEAGRLAYERGATDRGAVVLERALGALERLPRTTGTIRLEIDVRLRLFRCLNGRGDPRAAEHVSRARALLAEAPDDAREAVVLVEVAELRRHAGDVAGAIEAADRALVLTTRTAQPRVMAQAHFQLGVAHVTRGAYREGISHLKTTVASLAEAALKDRLGYPYATALGRLAWAFADLGELGEARRYATELAHLADLGDHALTCAEATTAAGVLALAEDRPADAVSPLARALQLGRDWHIRYVRAFGASWLALACARCGRAAEAATLIDECERDRVWEHVRLQWSRIIVRLAEARWVLGDGQDARALAERGLALARTVGEPVGEAEALGILAELDGLDEHATAAAAIAHRLELRPLRARLSSRASAAAGS